VGPANPKPEAGTVANVVAEVVEQFLHSPTVGQTIAFRGLSGAPVSTDDKKRSSVPQCGCESEPTHPAGVVCEADVRAAIEEHRKIPIGPGTIVTPSARDLAGEAGVLAPFKG
jgi:hypothetical protein